MRSNREDAMIDRTARSLGAALVIVVAAAATANASPCREDEDPMEFAVAKGVAAGDKLGTSVAAAGDVDNDGYDDVIVGAPFDKSIGIATGTAFVFSGRDASLIFKFSGDSLDDQLG